jgi:mono/diheme cytochrome c family protein
MKKNIVPFAIIAVVGIFAAIIVFYVGVHQREDIRLAEENGGEAVEDQAGEVSTDPEEIFAGNCATCHGGDLSGGMGPDLTKVGSELSADDIHTIIMNGQGAMPSGLVSAEEADALTEWLADMK